MEAEIEAMLLQAKEHQESPEAEESRKDSPLELSERAWPRTP